MTTLICEECGKIYHLDPEKLKGKLSGDEAKTRCRECGHLIRISREQLENGGDTKPPQAPADETPPMAEKMETPPSPSPPAPERKSSAKPKKQGSGTKGMGLRTKMFLLFLVVPLLLMAASGVFSQNQLNELARRITHESTRVVQGMAEEIIAEKARSVALQTKIYLRSHPELGKMDFNYDPEFSRIAVQRVGDSGYTVLFERPGVDEPDQAFRIWAHPDARLIGVPVLDSLRAALGAQYFSEFRKIFEEARLGREARGYYTWIERDGQLRQKFMVISPVEGTRYFIISTAYIDDFTIPVRKLEAEAGAMALQTRNIALGILLFSLLVIGLSISIYG